MQTYERLECVFGEWISNMNTVAVSSGTTALHLALEALRLPLGSKVIVPEFTMIACARAVTMAGLVPIFVDCTEDLLLDYNKIVCQHGISAIMPVHIYGRRCDMEIIHAIAHYHHWKVIEDMAEIHGVDPHPKTDAACWSFYKNKIIAGEEGGMISFKDKECAKYARLLRCQGFTEAHDFMHIPRGVNARLSNVHAELILESFRKYEENVRRRRDIEYVYEEIIPEECKMPTRISPWVYDIQVDDANKCVEELKNLGIQVRHSFKPMSMQPEYLGQYEKLVAYRRSKEVFYLPLDTSAQLTSTSFENLQFNGGISRPI